MARTKTNIQQYRCESITDLHYAFNEIKSTVAGDTKFMAQALLYIAERLTPPTKAISQKKPSEWNTFFSKGMKAGKSPAAIAAEWKARKK